MANVTGASLTPIYERLRDMPTHHPVSAETFSDWSLEAGDTVTISRDGKAYRSPVHTSTLTWKGKTPTITVNSTGNERRDAVSKVSRKKYNSGAAGMRNNQGLYNDVWSEDGHVHSVISQTASTLTLYVNNKYSQMTSGLKLTSSSAALYVNNKYTQMTSGLSLTSSSAALYVNNRYTQMSSGLTLTSSSAALYVNNKYSQMTSGLSLTSSSAALYVNNRYTQMSSGLKLTSSSAALYVNNKYAQMTSGLQLTSSSAALYVNSKYTQMQSGLSVTMSSACLYAKNRTTRAYIMTRINADGEGEALINADKVKISGTTTINDVMTITDQRLHVKTDARIQGDIMVESVTVRSGSDSQSISESDLSTTIKKATVSNNTLTLTQYNGSTITFSKATSLSGTWSGSGKLTVTASPQGETFERTLVAGTQSGNSIPIKAQWGASGQYVEDTGFSVIVPSYVSKLLRCDSKQQTYPGSTTYKYTFTLEGNYSFNVGTNYTMYRTSW